MTSSDSMSHSRIAASAIPAINAKDSTINVVGGDQANITNNFYVDPNGDQGNWNPNLALQLTLDSSIFQIRSISGYLLLSLLRIMMELSKLAWKTPANGSSMEHDLYDGNCKQTIFFGSPGCVRFPAIIESSLGFDLLWQLVAARPS
jgi:hypothetical protein